MSFLDRLAPRGTYRVHRERFAAADLDPARLLLKPRWSGARALYFATPEPARALVALGAVAETTGPGAWLDTRYQAMVLRACAGEAQDMPWCVGAGFDPGPAQAVEDALRAMIQEARARQGQPPPAVRPRRREATWRGFPPAALWLPSLCLVVEEGEATLWLSGYEVAARELADGAAAIRAQLAAPARAEHWSAHWPRRVRPAVRRLPEAAATGLRGRVTQALEAIERGEVRKVVVATSHAERLRWPTAAGLVLSRLRASQPGCIHYLVQQGAYRALVGASPERLVAVSGNQLTTMALAGSARRDADPAADQALGEALLASAKDRAEHQLVVDAIRAELQPLVASIELPETPRLRRLATIQHLETPITATLPGQGNLLEIAARLHPTPALAGTPREAALALIRRIEGDTRGWYGGLVGWVDGAGNGDLTVAIRCLLLAGDTATAFAGAGIVAGSDPDREVDEITLKLGAALRAVADRLE